MLLRECTTLVLLLSSVASAALLRPPSAVTSGAVVGRRLAITSVPLLAGASLWPAAAAPSSEEKLRNLPADELAKIVKADLVQRQFLVTGQLSREIYDETALFTDEIDTYTLDKWMKGTAALFVGSLSHVDLVGDVKADASEVSFRFSETLAFNLPFVKPKVPLTGRLVLTRGADGLITKYREFWDQGTLEVLSKAYL